MSDGYNVFLDTEVFDHEMYDFDSPSLGALRSISERGHVRVFLTEISRREVLNRVSGHVHQALKNTKEFRHVRSNRILRQIDSTFSTIFENHKVDDLIAVIANRFLQYCEATGVTTLPVVDEGMRSICDDYFNRRPPFDIDSKKTEFPDAISAATLNKWCDVEKQRIAIISRDNDWKRICDTQASFDWFPSIEEFLNANRGEWILDEALDRLESMSGEFSQYIGEEFLQLDFISTKVDIDVSDVEVNKVVVTRILVLEVENGRASATIECEVNFLVNVQCDVPGTGIYDREDDTVYGVDRSIGIVNQTSECVVDLLMTYDDSILLDESGESFRIEQTRFRETDIEIDCSSLLGSDHNW